MRKQITTAVAVLGLMATAARGGDIVETAAGNDSFSTLVAAVKAAGLVDTLKGDGPFTVFAPTNEAFQKLPEGTVENLLKPENKQQLVDILTYHVVAGSVPAAKVTELNGAATVNGQRVDISTKDGVQVDDATVVKTDIECSNGIIHVIDTVLIPASGTIPEVAQEAGKFNTLLAAVKAAGLADALSGEGPFTVFAPTDAAFEKLPEGTVENLLKPENKQQLAAILKYHVVSGRVYSNDALSAKEAETLQGAEVHVMQKDGAAYVNKSKLVATDIDAANGVIHVIDAVLLPPEKKSPAEATRTQKAEPARPCNS